VPYASVAELPPQAREIFLQAFNHAWEEYASPSTRYAGSSREETAMRVAWAAVKRKYVKTGDRWRPLQQKLTAPPRRS
jgi:cation transport regulator